MKIADAALAVVSTAIAITLSACGGGGGDAAISVAMTSLTGRAGFTNLESWSARAAPGAVGTGVTWGDGDLAYSIAVTGNSFQRTGGDQGSLTGVFTGRSHEGAAGTLERSDLTAAFGGHR